MTTEKSPTRDGRGRLRDVLRGAVDRVDRRVWLGLVVLAALVIPFTTNAYWTDVFNYLGLYVLLGLSLNIIVGNTGLFNLGQAAFYAIGAYLTAILNTRYHIPTLLLLPAAAVVAAAVGALVARPILHLRGDYLAIVTIGFGEIVRIALTNNPWGLTGGPNGIIGIQRPAIGPIAVRTPFDYYFLIWVVVAVVVWASVRLDSTRIGRAWRYVREDELAAEAMGIDTGYFKMLAFALGAGIAGIAGNLYASKMTVISPDSFNFWESVVMFVIVVLGGAGSIPGVFVGAAAMVILPEIFREFALWRMLVFGAAMVVMMIFRPEGLWPSRQFRQELAPQEPTRVTAAGEGGTGGHAHAGT